MFNRKILRGVREGAASAPIQMGKYRTQQNQRIRRWVVGIFKRFARYFCYSGYRRAEIESRTRSAQSPHQPRIMNCVFVRTGQNRKYTATKKNGGIVEKPKDERLKAIPIKCGRCIECRKEKARGWQLRLEYELENDQSARFMTMTFRDGELEKLAKDEERAVKIAVQRFIDRWKHEKGAAPKHWLITERGQQGSERIHLHGFLFTMEDAETIERIWKYGWVDTGQYVNEKSIGYCVKYVYKYDEKHPGFKPQIFCTKRLGSGLVKKLSRQKYDRLGELTTTVKLKNGQEIQMPEYYKKQVFTDDEREELRIRQLDNGELYVKGVKFDVSTRQGQQHYMKALDRRRGDLIKMGYDNRKSIRKFDEENLKQFM